MILFRSPRLHGRARLRVRKLGLTDREVASMLAPVHSGSVEVAPVEPPVGEGWVRPRFELVEGSYPEGEVER